jgi:glutamate racemase
VLEQYLQPLMDRQLDVLLLGCTHYPLLKGLIAQVVGEEVRVIDSAETCAEDVRRRLQSAGLLRGGEPRDGALKCFVTDDSPRFARLAEHFLGFSVAAPTWVAPDDLYAALPPASEPMRQAG